MSYCRTPIYAWRTVSSFCCNGEVLDESVGHHACLEQFRSLEPFIQHVRGHMEYYEQAAAKLREVLARIEKKEVGGDSSAS